MTPCRNLEPHDPANGRFGDCQRCCVAAILDLDPLDVPHFLAIAADMRRNWIEVQRDWLALYGLTYVRFGFLPTETLENILAITAANCPGVPLILGGQSGKLAGVGHSVVIMDGEIVMDPSGSGISGPLPDEKAWVVEAIGVGPNWGGRSRLVPQIKLELDAEIRKLAGGVA